MSYCTPCPPCDSEYPLLCEPLETTANGKRLVVEDSAACQKTIQTPASGQVLTSNNGTLGWTSGGNSTVLSKSSSGNLEFGKVQTDYIADGAVTTAKIADSAVTTAKVSNSAISNDKIRNSIGTSIIGRSANSTGVVADIQATANEQFLKRSGDALVFSAINPSVDFPSGAVINCLTITDNTTRTIDFGTGSGNIPIPYDNTTPQISEGVQIIELTITPKKLTNKIVARISFTGTTASGELIAALFRNNEPNAICTAVQESGASFQPLILDFVDTPNSTSATRYSIRVGGSSTNDVYYNKPSNSVFKFNQTLNTVFTLTEINA
jgi:hypothetical protein